MDKVTFTIPIMSQLEKGLQAFQNQDYEQAFLDLTPLAQEGNAEAQCIIGNLYHLGLGVHQNLTEAVKWYRKSAQQNYAIAAHNLGTIYLMGDPEIPQDINKAEKWFQTAKQQGFIPSPSDYLLTKEEAKK